MGSERDSGNQIRRIAVFCGSRPGADPEFMRWAREVGRTLAERDISVVYGGAKIGLMGAVADGALEAGGEVIGVIPNFLQDLEVAHQGLSDLILVESMHERKL